MAGLEFPERSRDKDMFRSKDSTEPCSIESGCADANHAGAGHLELSRRRFLQSAAFVGASAAVPGAAYAAAPAKAGSQANAPRAKEEGPP